MLNLLLSLSHLGSQARKPEGNPLWHSHQTGEYNGESRAMVNSRWLSEGCEEVRGSCGPVVGLVKKPKLLKIHRKDGRIE